MSQVITSLVLRPRHVTVMQSGAQHKLDSSKAAGLAIRVRVQVSGKFTRVTGLGLGLWFTCRYV